MPALRVQIAQVSSGEATLDWGFIRKGKKCYGDEEKISIKIGDLLPADFGRDAAGMLTWRAVPRSRCALDSVSRGCSCSALLRVTKHRVWLEPWLGRVARVLVTLCCWLFSVNRTLCSFVQVQTNTQVDQLFVVSHNSAAVAVGAEAACVLAVVSKERHITF